MHPASKMARILMSSGLIAATASPVAQAGVWNIAGQGSVGANYDDNVRLSSSNQVADWSGVADASGTLSYQDDAFLFQVNPRVLTARYDVEHAFNRTEEYLTLLVQKTTETGGSSVSLSGTQDTTLTSEPGFTGLSDVNKKHRVGSVTVANSWNLTERMVASTQVYASANRYLDAQLTGLVDYNYGSGVVSASYDWTERSSFTLQASIGKLQVPDIAAYDKVNMSVTLGYRVHFANKWNAELSFGPSKIRTEGRSDTGTVYNASLIHDAELTHINLSVDRDVTPNGYGLLSRREQLRFGLTRELSARWVTDWSATVSRNQNVLPAGGIAQDAVNYADVTGNLGWRMTPTWSVALVAGYTRQRISNVQLAAERQHIALNLTWNGLVRPLH